MRRQARWVVELRASLAEKRGVDGEKYCGAAGTLSSKNQTTGDVVIMADVQLQETG